MTDIHQELLRLIALNHTEQWIPEEITFQELLDRHGDRLIPGLIECLTNQDAKVRHLAIMLLSEGRPQSDVAIPAFIERLTDEDRIVRNAAVWCLMDFGDAARPAILALKRLLDDDTEPYIRISAAGAISHIAPDDPTAVPMLVEGLRDPVGLHRARACEFLGNRRNKSAVLNAMTLLSDPEFAVRFAAGVAVGRTFNHWFHAVAVCVAMLTDRDEQNRSLGRESLLRLGPYAKADIDLLTMALVDASPAIRHEIEEVIEALRRH